MGQQVVRQPDGLLAIYCTNSDTILMWDASEADVLAHFAERAEDRAREDIRKAKGDAQEAVAAVLAGEPRKVYYQFAVGWDEAVEGDRGSGGEFSRRTV